MFSEVKVNATGVNYIIQDLVVPKLVYKALARLAYNTFL